MTTSSQEREVVCCVAGCHEAGRFILRNYHGRPSAFCTVHYIERRKARNLGDRGI